MHVLCYDGVPIACAERMERLNMAMSAYTPKQQLLMSIHSVEVIE
jgi:hypothetical protein